ncbi:Clp protease N-terminal domain-containing protein, partial [Acinetobacter baumannii]
MRFDKLTVKNQEAFQAAQQVAERFQHQNIEPEHLLLALMRTEAGLTFSMVEKVGADPAVLAREMDD